MEGFSGGTVNNNPPYNARDTGLIPGPGRAHMPWSSQARAPERLSPHAATTEALTLEPVLHSKRSHRNEKPTYFNKE